MGARLKHAWNALLNRDPTQEYKKTDYGTYSSTYRPDRVRMSYGNERGITGPIYNKIAMDVSAVQIRHVRLDEQGRYKENIQSSLDNCLTLEANIDQSGRELIKDAVMSLFDEGCIAIVPIDTNVDPEVTNGFDILSLRVAKILEWYPETVKVRVYNDRKGVNEDILVSKRYAAIVENPFYSVMNEPNGTLKRLIEKLNLLDAVDKQSGSGKLDMIIQLPYVIKSEARREQADKRLKDLEDQLRTSPFGIGYVDGTEKIIQLNRPVENNLMKQIEYLTNLFYSQMCLTPEIINGTASEEAMLNYYNCTVYPTVQAILDAMKRKFLTKTARTQGQSLEIVRNLFALLPLSKLAEVGDSFTRNEILSPQEMRGLIGFKPADDAKADELRNRNMPPPEEATTEDQGQSSAIVEEMLNGMDLDIDEILAGLGDDDEEETDEE